jgi:Carboxypeptidase regulatory-like domain
MYALVGTVVDFESGQPLGSSEIIVRRASDGKIVSALTDARGGFVMPRIPPGQYGLIVRRLGYTSLSDLRTAEPGVVDTLRLKMIQTDSRLLGRIGRNSD